MPKNSEKEEESEKNEYEGEYNNGHKSGDAVEFLIELESEGQLSFEDIDFLMHYVDARLAKKVLRQDLASGLRRQSQRSFCLRTVIRDKNQQQQQQK